VNLEPYVRKRDEQRDIRVNRIDVVAIQKAFKAFSGLQHVQLLRRVDTFDGAYLDLTSHYPQLRNWADLNWVQACFYSIKTVAEAILVTESKCSRFSSPHLNSHSALMVVDNPSRLGAQLNQANSLVNLAMQLTCLELHFDNHPDWSSRRGMTSQQVLPFYTVLRHARNLEALHLGFPVHQPLELDLHEVFRSLTWEKLLALGIQGWVISGDDIETLTKRHREKLRGLRLRNVYLKGERRWPSVLCYLRNNLHRLEWVSLRRIAYLETFLNTPMGIEITDLDLESDDDSEDDDMDDMGDVDDDDMGGDDGDGGGGGSGGDMLGGEVEPSGDAVDSDDLLSDEDDADGSESMASESPSEMQASHAPEFPAVLLGRAWVAPCTCGSSRQISEDDASAELGDFEREVIPNDRRSFWDRCIPNDQRRFWERWAVNSCALHGRDAG
jgi:hypothetical protein